jgi:non-specific serine/threonine protein kinase
MRVGPYVIERELGRGGMGVVFLARDTRLERRVAVKMLPAPVADDRDRLARFRREALLLATLNHPNIAQIHDLEEQDGRQHLILEYVPGEGLDERLQRGPLPSAEALELILQVARGIRAAHEHGVIHRDLKPSNVRITAEGVAKLIDFGLAKSAAAPEDDGDRAAPREDGPPSGTGLSGAGTLLGTPAYMSPERVRGEPAGPAADLWAFGCLLYECLAGAPAFEGRTTPAVLDAIVHRDVDLGRLPGPVPVRIRRLLRRCLDREISSRPEGIDVVERELELALAEQAATTDRVAGAPEAAPVCRLPRQASSFVGRERELRESMALLASTSLLTLIGPGGCGKTRLALELAAGRASGAGEDVWLAELGSLADAAIVPATVAAALAIKEDTGRSPLESIIDRLRDRPALIVLDNCEHLLGACAEISEALLRACPGLRIVATSRERLGLAGECVFQVPPLTLPDEAPDVDRRRAAASESVRLFVDRARAVDASFELNDENAAVVAGICRRLDGLPLAIELAAARARVLSVQQIAERLDDALRLLTDGSPTAARRRHRTLEAALDWSYDSLEDRERRMLRALSVFAGTWTLESVAAVCAPEQDEFDVLDLLTHLVDKSLVGVAEGPGAERRYRLLETTRQYARRRLSAAGEESVMRDRHLEHYLAVAEAAVGLRHGREEGRGLRRLEADHRDLLAALGWADGSRRRAVAGLRLAAELAWFWRQHGHFTVGRLALASALRRGGPAAPPALRARAMDGAAVLAWRQGDLAAALSLHVSALRLWRRAGDPRSLADSLNGLGNVAYVQRRYGSARRLHERALAIRREQGDERGVSGSLTNLGNVAFEQGDYEEARSLHESALAMSRRMGNTAGVGSSLNNLGNVAIEAGDLEAARALHEQSLEIKRSLGDRWGIGASYVNLGHVARLAGDVRQALRMYADSLAVWRDLGDRLGIAEVLESVAALAARSDEADHTVRLLAAADRLREEARSPLPANAQARHEELVAEMRTALGAAAFEHEWSLGRGADRRELVDGTLRWLRTAADSTVIAPRRD